jgi:hypothetical protein
LGEQLVLKIHAMVLLKSFYNHYLLGEVIRFYLGQLPHLLAMMCLKYFEPAP